MANLRLLCAILVLAVVCYEANAYTYWDCANFSKTLSCGHKHISIANVWYGRRYKTVFFAMWSKNSWKNGKCRNAQGTTWIPTVTAKTSVTSQGSWPWGSSQATSLTTSDATKSMRPAWRFATIASEKT